MTILKEQKLKESGITLYDIANDPDFESFKGFVYQDKITNSHFEVTEPIVRIAFGGNGKNVDHVTFSYKNLKDIAVVVTNKMKIYKPTQKTINFYDVSRGILITFCQRGF